MFVQLNPSNARRERWIRAASVAAHGLVLAWFLRSPTPIKLIANSVALGQNGKALTRLYWASKHPDDSDQSSSDTATQRYRHQRLGHEKLMYKANAQQPKLTLPRNTLARTEAEDKSSTQTLSALGHGAQAGALYGTLRSGVFTGDEIRPALPSVTSDPVVYPWQLPTTPGNEIIEITIDERGEIVRKTVLVSLGPDIDEKCLAALENWHFHPATRNGAPIPSKQDAIFPFHARG